MKEIIKGMVMKKKGAGVFLIPVFIITALMAKDRSYVYIPDGADFFVYSRGSDTFIINRSRYGEKKFTRIINMLSSGKRINAAADDPAGLAVSEKMDSMLEQIMRESMNDADMRNLHGFIEATIAADQELVKRVRELALRAASGILGPDDRELIQLEVDQLLAQINMNARFTQFNKLAVIPELTTNRLGLDKINVTTDPRGAIGLADTALNALTVKRIMRGVKTNILTLRIRGKSYYYLNLQRAESGMTDLEMEEGISELAGESVLIRTRYGVLVRWR